MSDTTFNWSTDSDNGFFVNVTGNLDSSGKIWSGNSGSPSGVWRINIDSTCGVNLGAPVPNYAYDLHMGNVVANQNFGSAAGFDIYASGFGISSWGSGLNPPPSPPNDVAPYLPRFWNWPFTFAASGSGPAPAGWSGAYYITLMRGPDPADFTTWRYSLDLFVNGPVSCAAS